MAEKGGVRRGGGGGNRREEVGGVGDEAGCRTWHEETEVSAGPLPRRRLPVFLMGREELGGRKVGEGCVNEDEEGRKGAGSRDGAGSIKQGGSREQGAGVCLRVVSECTGVGGVVKRDGDEGGGGGGHPR
jgi:hypothetical protein